MIFKAFDLASSLAASAVTTPRGLLAQPVAEQPRVLIRLYDMENCPYCRIVREAITSLDIDVMILPCPKGGERYRPEVVSRGGKAQFPFMVDPNTNTELYDSVAIIEYLFRTYANRRPAPAFWLRSVNTTAAQIASGLRLGRGLRAISSRAPKAPLELYSFEGSPFARLVRERLCELEVPYTLRTLGKVKLTDFIPPPVRDQLIPEYHFEGRNRSRLHEIAGQVQVPYLIDSNTDVAMFESEDILAYLDRTYAA
ncbi:MAG: glutathione S-transferase N-terminal domain-containing protein [Pseudomonadota bacterium]